LHFPDTMEILSPQETWAASFPMWVQVFNLHFPDKMEILSPQDVTRRHRHLILNGFQEGIEIAMFRPMGHCPPRAAAQPACARRRRSSAAINRWSVRR